MSDQPIQALLKSGFAIDTKPANQSIARSVLVFSQSQGTVTHAIFGTSGVHPRDALNIAYYGQSVSPEDILLKRSVSNPSAAELQDILARASK